MYGRVICTFALLALLAPSVALAGGFCCQVSTGVQKGFYTKGDVTLGVDYSYSHMSRFQKGGDEVSLASVMDDPRFRKMLPGGRMGVVPEKMHMQRITMSAAYSPVDRLMLNVSVPYVINDMTMFMWRDPDGMMGPLPADWDWMAMDRVEGIGDVTLTGVYRVYQDDPDMPKTAVTLGAGVKFPTGSSTASNANGSRIHAHMQPGTGSWDPIFMAGVSRVITPSLFVQADARYQVATANSLGYEFGDTVGVDASLKYNLKYVNLGLGVEYFHSEQSDDPSNKYNGQRPERLTDFVGYTGEDSIWIAPEVQILPFNGASIDLKFEYPMYYHVPTIQQVTDYRVSAGFSYTF